MDSGHEDLLAGEHRDGAHRNREHRDRAPSNRGRPGEDRPAAGSIALAKPDASAHVEILRVDHWFKNVFVLPGIVIPLSLDPALATSQLPLRIVIGCLSIGVVASSNYVLNEILDAPCDRLHPSKARRPVPSGRVSIPLAYAQWLVLLGLGLGLATAISEAFVITMAIFWLLGCAYNMPPVRLKDIPYVDVLTESLNNPVRMLAGWTIVGASLTPPISLLLSYWMVGCYFMAMKRFAEY